MHRLFLLWVLAGVGCGGGGGSPAASGSASASGSVSAGSGSQAGSGSIGATGAATSGSAGSGALSSGTSSGAASASGSPSGASGTGAESGAPDGASGSPSSSGALASSGGGSASGEPIDAAASGAADSSAGFVLTSSAFTEGATVPVLYKCTEKGGGNTSPPLAWTVGPAGTQSYAMTLVHFAADMSVHWVLWNIPSSVTSLDAGVSQVASPPVPAGSSQMKSNVDGATWYGYQGPCPQSAGTNQYQYAVYAIDAAALPGVTTQSTGAAVLAAVKAHSLASATLTGTQTE